MEQNGAGFRKTPAPIFSKKPRQALFAHPNNLNSSNDTNGTYTAGRYNQTEPTGGTCRKRSFEDNNRNVKEVRREDTGCYRYGQGNEVKSFKDSNQHVFEKRTTPYGSLASTFKPQTSSRNQSQFRQETYSKPQPVKTPSFHEPTPPMPSFTHARPGNNKNTNQTQVGSYGSYVVPSYCGPGGHTATPSPMKGLPSHGHAALPNYTSSGSGYSGGNQSAKSKADYHKVNEKHSTSTENRAGVSAAVLKTEYKSKKKEVDSSLRLITTSVQGLKHWAQYNSRLSMIFEVFGHLDSAVTAEDKSSARIFRLKDEKDCLDCIFYQIDRTLPSMMRGRWYRCVGKWNQRKENFHCLSVREASEEERSVYKLKINTSDRAMREWKFKHSEF